MLEYLVSERVHSLLEENIYMYVVNMPARQFPQRFAFLGLGGIAILRSWWRVVFVAYPTAGVPALDLVIREIGDLPVRLLLKLDAWRDVADEWIPL